MEYLAGKIVVKAGRLCVAISGKSRVTESVVVVDKAAAVAAAAAVEAEWEEPLTFLF